MKKTRNAPNKEIAERLGVSIGTVSLVLNGRGDELRISKATQHSVKEMARELRYQPTKDKRNLSSIKNEKSSKVIAVFWSTEFMDDMMGRFFIGLHKTTEFKGYNIEFFIQLFDFDMLSEWKDSMSSAKFSGIILSGVSERDMEFLNANTFDLPIVLINQNNDRYHFVYINNYEIGKSVAMLFHSRNHKHIGLISMNRKGQSATLRQVGFLEACKKLDKDVRPEWLDELGGRDYASGYKAAQRMLQNEERPDAIFVMSYGQVLGVVEACKHSGLKIPEDIEILTYGDSLSFQRYSPTVSSVYTPIEALAENALNLLVLVIDNDIDMPMSRMLYAKYAFRASCGGFNTNSDK